MRHRIWREIGRDGATISQLTHRLATNKGNVAHHLKVLVAAGLVAKGTTRTVRGGTEQYYVHTSRRLRFDAGDSGTSTVAMLSSVADEVTQDPSPLLSLRTVRMTRKQADALARHLDSILKTLEPAGPREASYGVLVGVYRQLPGPPRVSSGQIR